MVLKHFREIDQIGNQMEVVLSSPSEVVVANSTPEGGGAEGSLSY